MSIITGATLLALGVFASPAMASEPSCLDEVQAFTLRFGDMTIGHMVAVDTDCEALPSGMQAAGEYWSWTAGPEWPGAFAMSATTELPDLDGRSWEHFDPADLSHDEAEPFPELGLMPADRLYEIEELDNGFVVGGTGYLWVLDGSERLRTWLAQGSELPDYLAQPGSQELRFRAVFAPPAPESEEVVIVE